MRVLYASTARLMGQLKAAKAKGTILTELKRIERTDLLILDDFGIHPFDAAARSSLMDIIENLRRTTTKPPSSPPRFPYATGMT